VRHPTPGSTAVKRAWYADAFLGYIYASIEYEDGSIWHHYLDGSSATYIADANCPHGKAVTKQAGKIWANKKTSPLDVVRFSKANDPRDWTTASDAGYLAVGLQQEGAQDCYALGQFQNQIVCFFADGAQVWDVDPNPAFNVLKQRIFGVGTRYPLTPTSFASDVFFLADVGVRSVTINTQTDNYLDVDVGSPIDELLTTIDANGDRVVNVGTYEPIALYVPGLQQFWLFVGSTVWVYTFSRSAKVAAWGKYTIPYTPDDAAVLNNRVYIRVGDEVYRFAPGAYDDVGALIPVRIRLAYLNAKQPGMLKQWTGADWNVVGTGGEIEFIWDPNDDAKITNMTPISGASEEGVLQPVEVCSVGLAPVITHQAATEFEFSRLQLYYEVLGPV
jgi:hypothetical protein